MGTKKKEEKKAEATPEVTPETLEVRELPAHRQTNLVVFEGNLGSDPETRVLESGQTVSRFSLGNSDDYIGNNGNAGEIVRRTNWATVECWNRLAEVIEEYTHKGSHVLVEGKLKLATWQSDLGETRNALRIQAFRIRLLDPAPRMDDAEIPEEIAASASPDDIPF